MLRQGLISAFPREPSLERVLLGLGKRLGEIVSRSSLNQQVAELILAAEAQGWIAELILAAVESQPDNPRLRSAAAAIGLEPPEPGTDS
jgi:hypothetical protein